MAEDMWEPAADDRESYHRGVNRLRESANYPWPSDALLDAGLRAAFASLRARVGEPITAELITAGAGGWEYTEVTSLDAVNVHGADGWRLVHPMSEACPVYVLERPVTPADDDDG